MAALIKDGKVQYRVHLMDFIGSESQWAAEGALCAADQDKFWAYDSLLFSNQHGENQGNFTKGRLKAFASKLGLDTEKFNTCLDSDQYRQQVTESNQAGGVAGVKSTPSFQVNGKLMTAQRADFSDIISAINQELNK